MAYPTTTEHHKLYPYTSVMASPYSCDPTGVVDIAASIEQIKANQSNVGDIYFPHGTWKLATNLTIPAGIRLVFERGAIISIATGVTLTINGTVSAGPYQIFTCSGTGSVVFGVGTNDRVYCEWWATNTTPGTTNMTSALVAARTAFGGDILLLGTTYLVDANSLKYSAAGQGIVGQGAARTIIKNNSTTGFVISRDLTVSGNLPNCKLQGVTIDMDSKGSVGVMWEGMGQGATDTGGSYIKDVCVKNVPTGTFSYNDGNGASTYEIAGVYVKSVSGHSGAFRNLLEQITVIGISDISHGKYGIYLTGTKNPTGNRANFNTLIRCYAKYFEKGIVNDYGNDNTFFDCEGTDCDYGLYIDGSVANGNVSRAKVYNFYAETCAYAPLYLGSYSEYCEIFSNGSGSGGGAYSFLVTSPTGTFTAGKTITGGTSLQTATVVSHKVLGGQNFLVVWSVSGTFTSGETVTESDTGLTATYRSALVEFAVNLGAYNNSQHSDVYQKKALFNNGFLDNIGGITFRPQTYANGCTYIRHPGGSSGRDLVTQTYDASGAYKDRIGLGTKATSVAFELKPDTYIKRNIGAWVAVAGANTLPGDDVISVSAVGAVSVTSITATAANTGREVTIIFADGNVTLTDGSNLKLAGSITGTADDTIKLICNGTNWYEISRSVN